MDEGGKPNPDEGARGRRPMARRLVVAVMIGLALMALWQMATWPRVGALMRHDPETTAFIDRHRARTGAAPDWRVVPYEGIARSLKRAVVASEDMGFFDHRGFALDEIEAALRDTLEDGKPLRGASTITQQLAKNLYLSPSRHPWRKAKEAVITVQLERALDKRRILELYLNVAQFGPGIFGAEAAAQRYFGRPAAQLDSQQAAALAAGLPNPDRWHPGATSERYQRRVRRIAARVRQAAWLDRVIP